MAIFAISWATSLLSAAAAGRTGAADVCEWSSVGTAALEHAATPKDPATPSAAIARTFLV